MLTKFRLALAVTLAATLLAGSVGAADLTDSLKSGTPDLKSAGALTFGPEGILFVADTQGAAIFAIDTNDRPKEAATGGLKVEKLDEKVSGLLGTSPKEITINDMAVNPASGNVYFSVSRGRGAQAAPVLVRVNRKDKIEEVSLKNVKFSKTTLPNPGTQAQQRQQAVTCLGYSKGRVIVAGLSNEEWASTLRSIPFPFTEADRGTGVGIFHGAHGRFETAAPVRTFATYDIQGEAHLLAAYTCTPLVKFPVNDLKTGTKVKGTTIAELGSGNQPLDMVIYQKGGKDYILLANNRRGVMKITTDNISSTTPITEPVKGGATAGLKYETIKELTGVVQLAKLDAEHALVLRTVDGAMNLETVPLP